MAGLCRLLLCLAVGSSWLVSFSAFAGSPRFVVILEEAIEGDTPTVPEGQGVLETGLVEKGYKVVSGKQVAAARKDASIALMMKGQVPERVTALDADFLIVGRVDATRLGQIEGTDFRIYIAGVKVSVVRIGTGEIVWSYVGEVRGDGISEKTAARRAQKNSGKEVLQDLLAVMPQITALKGEIELVVHGIPDQTRVEEVTAALNGCKQLKKVTLRATSTEMTKYDLDSKVNSLKLASSMNANRAIPLRIVATGSGSVLARYDVERTLNLGLVVTRPVNQLGAGYKWVDKVLPEILEAELQNVEFLKVLAAEVTPKLRRGKPRFQELQKIAKDHQGAPLLLVVTAMSAGKQVTLGLKVYETIKGNQVFSATASGDPRELPPVVRQLAQKLSSDLLPSIAKAKRLSKFEQFSKAISLQGQAGPAGPAPGLRIARINIENLFPSRFEYYFSEEHGVGEVVLQAKKDTEPRDVKVSVFIPKFMSLPSESLVDKIKKGAEVKVPVRLTLDADKIFKVDENTPVQAEVKLGYRTADGLAEGSRVVPLIVFDRNAIDWSEPESISAFVTFREESVKALARKVIAAKLPADLPAGLREAAAVFSAMRQIKIKYQKDPQNPFQKRRLDYVQYPRETLSYRTGDCDDLAVLYAALLESVGVQTAFITTPGHILTAFKAPAGAEPITHDPDRYLEEEGRVWIPVETTSLDRSFEEAWRRGAREVKRWRGKKDKLALLPVHRAWKKFPAVSLPQEVKETAVDVAALEAGLKQEAEAVLRQRDRSYKKRLADLKKKIRRKKKDAALRNEYALLLARGGELKEAAGELDQALKLKPGDARATCNLANVRLLLGKFKEAVGLYQKALELDEKLGGRVYANVGLAYYCYGDLEKAKQAFSACARCGGGGLFASMGLVPPREAEGTLAAEKKPRKKEVIERELEKVLLEALESAEKKKTGDKKEKKPDLFSNPLPTGGRRGDDPASQRRLVDLLSWFR